MTTLYIAANGKAFEFREEAAAEDMAPATEVDLDHLYDVLRTYAHKTRAMPVLRHKLVDVMHELDIFGEVDRRQA